MLDENDTSQKGKSEVLASVQASVGTLSLSGEQGQREKTWKLWQRYVNPLTYSQETLHQSEERQLRRPHLPTRQNPCGCNRGKPPGWWPKSLMAAPSQGPRLTLRKIPLDRWKKPTGGPVQNGLCFMETLVLASCSPFFCLKIMSKKENHSHRQYTCLSLAFLVNTGHGRSA